MSDMENTASRKSIWRNYTILAFGVCLLLAGVVPGARAAAPPDASGTFTSSGSGPYTYSITFSNSASALSPVGSVWYSWVPGFFYLPGTPTGASAPAGWTAMVVGDSVQFSANSAGADILAGQSLSGFSYTATFTPAQLAAAANSGVSVAYSGGFFSDAGNTFTVAPGSVPEPSIVGLLALGTVGLQFVRRHKANRG